LWLRLRRTRRSRSWTSRLTIDRETRIMSKPYGPLCEAPNFLQRRSANHPWLSLAVFVLLMEGFLSIPVWMSVMDKRMSLGGGLKFLGAVFLLMYIVGLVAARDWIRMTPEARGRTVVRYAPSLGGRNRANVTGSADLPKVGSFQSVESASSSIAIASAIWLLVCLVGVVMLLIEGPRLLFITQIVISFVLFCMGVIKRQQRG
jgi:hypothetical protein